MVSGLSQSEVNEKIRNKQVNVSKIKTGKSYFQIVFGNIFTYFNLIFTILALLVLSSGSIKNASFMVVVICNAVIGIVQEIQAKHVLDKMNLLNAPKSKVIRDGQESVIDSTKIVLGDFIRFVSGDQIPADCTVVEGKVAVNESLLTGEQDEINKEKDANLMSGSFIVSGECIATATAVGSDSYISKLSASAKKMNSKEKSEMVKSVDIIVKVAGVLIIPIGIALFYLNYFSNGYSYAVSITTMVAAVVGMIPEGLYLLLTLALAAGAVRLAKDNVLLHEMKSIESLARVDVFCVDKTGTITESKMNVTDVIPLEDMGGLNKEEFEKVLNTYVISSTDNNGTMLALKDFFELKTYDLPEKKVVQVYPFSSKYKFGAITYEDETWILGAPEFVLKDLFKKYEDRIREAVEKGYRVLVFARQKKAFSPEEFSDDRVALGFIVLSNSIRANAKQTFEYFKEQGVIIKVISGDNPKTVSEVSRLAGIENSEKYIDANTLDTEEKVFDAVDEYTVFGRVTPEQKKRLVKALRKKGHHVAMTGDGVNDILAMKSANCSIAMASGSEAASQSAQLVLLDSDFGHMPAVVAEGRRVVNNIKRSASLFLVKNIFSFVLASITLALALRYPLKPTHMMLISLFTIGLPGMLIAFEPNNNRITGNFIKDVIITALPAGLTDAIILATVSIVGVVFNLELNYTGTTSTILLAVVGFMILRKILMPFTKHRLKAFALCIFGMVMLAIAVPEIFDLISLDKITVLMVILIAFAAESLYRNLSIFIGFVVNKIDQKYAVLTKENE